MFRLSFFGSFTRQRAALLSATAFAPIPLHPAVERQLELARAAPTQAPPRIDSPWGLYWHSLRGVKELIVEHIAWTTLSALVVLGSVFVAREVFQAQIGVSEGLILASAFFALKVTQAALEYFNACRRLQVHRGIQITLYSLINAKLALIAPSARADISKGQLKTLVGSDVESIEDFISAAIQQWIPVLVSIAILVPVLAIVSGVLGLFALLAALAILPIVLFSTRFVERYQRRAQSKRDDFTTIVGEWIKNIRLVRYLGWERALEREIGARMRRYVLLDSIRHAVAIFIYALSSSWTMVPLLALLCISPLLQTPLNLLQVFSSFWILDHLLTQITNLPYSFTLYGTASAGAKRVIDLLRRPNVMDSFLPPPEHGSITNEEPTALILRGATVSFGDQRALDNVTLRIALNQRTAIVGSVGSGKTTLLEVLLGEIPLSSGSVLVEFDRHSEIPLWRADAYRRLRSLIAYSPQQPFLSNASMRDNVDLSTVASSLEIDSAVMAAQLREDLLAFPRGLEEEVGESGINLSGGQKQRVSLARVFISKRPIVLLDDPLSAVDPKTEELLMDSILDHEKGVILVSHRLAELARCDRILVLEHGAIVEDSDPTTLGSDETSQFSKFLKAAENHDL